MRAWVIVLVLVIVGIVGAWVGYWIGHALGWTTNSEFPLTLGGGERAIGLSIGLSFVSVLGAGWLLIGMPQRRLQELAVTGAPGRARILRMWRTGIYVARRSDRPRHELAFEIEMHPESGPPYGTTAKGLLTEDEEARLGPGTEASVRYDPSHPSSVVVVGPMVPSAG
jgi:hypothetical protein